MLLRGCWLPAAQLSVESVSCLAPQALQRALYSGQPRYVNEWRYVRFDLQLLLQQLFSLSAL
jgi:hypothetical protein